MILFCDVPVPVPTVSWIPLPVLVRIYNASNFNIDSSIYVYWTFCFWLFCCKKLNYLSLCAVLRIRIRCLFDPWIRDPGGIKSGSGSGMNYPDHISVLRNHFIGFKYLKFWCRSGMENFCIWSRMEKFGSGILDKQHDPQHWLFVYTEPVIYQSIWIQIWNWIHAFLIHTENLNNKFTTDKTKHFSFLFF